jgi:hypothetical protein
MLRVLHIVGRVLGVSALMVGVSVDRVVEQVLGKLSCTWGE